MLRGLRYDSTIFHERLTRKRPVAWQIVALVVFTVQITDGRRAFAQEPSESASPPPRPWGGKVGAGLSLTSGNSDTLTYNIAFDVTHDPKTRNVLSASGLYIRGQQNKELAVDRTSLAIRDQYAISPRAFVFGEIEYLRDAFKLIDYHIAPTVGIGLKVFDTDRTKFSVDAGAGLAQEKNPGRGVRTSGAVTAAENLEHKLTSTSTITHSATALWNAGRFPDGLYRFSAGLSTRISQRVELSVNLLDTFKNRPPTAETKRNDVSLLMAITARY